MEHDGWEYGPEHHEHARLFISEADRWRRARFAPPARRRLSFVKALLWIAVAAVMPFAVMFGGLACLAIWDAMAG